MLKAIFKAGICCLLLAGLLGFSASVRADQKQEAISLVQEAIAYYKANGEEKTMKAINEDKMFQKGELYLWIFRTNFKDNAVLLAHGTNQTLVGKEWYNIKDPDGKYFYKEIIQKAIKSGKGWVEYRWAHPTKKKGYAQRNISGKN